MLSEVHVVLNGDIFCGDLNIDDVVEPPELSRLKCAGHHHKGNTDSNALQTEQFLVCWQWRMQDERQGGAETMEMLICVKI